MKELHSGKLITKDQQSIAFSHYMSGHSKLILILHGFYNSMDAVVLQQLAEELCLDYDVFMFDFRGHGKSSGLFSWISKEGDDLKAVLDYLHGKYEKKGIVAFSMGSSVSINVLSKYPEADSLICISPPSDFSKVDYHFWELDLKGDFIYTLCTAQGRKGKGLRPGPFWLKKEKPIENIGKISIPVLYIHGEKDWVIKPWHSQVLFEKTLSQKQRILIKKGTHGEYLIRDNPEVMFRLIKDWFAKTL